MGKVSQTYAYTHTMSNLSKNRIERSINFKNVSESISHQMKQQIHHETHEAKQNTEFLATGNDTGKVLKNIELAAATVNGARQIVSSAVATKQLETMLNRHDVRLTGATMDGSYTSFVSEAQTMGFQINQNFIMRDAGYGAGLQILNPDLRAKDQANVIRRFDKLIDNKIKEAKKNGQDISDLVKQKRFGQNWMRDLDAIDKKEHNIQHLSKSGRRHLCSPIRMVTSPLRQSEVGSGYTMAKNAAMPAIMFANQMKFVPVNLAINAAGGLDRLRLAAKIQRDAAKTATKVSLRGALKQANIQSKIPIKKMHELMRPDPITRAVTTYFKGLGNVARRNIFNAIARRAAGNSVTAMAGDNFIATWASNKAQMHHIKAEFKKGNITKHTYKQFKSAGKLDRLKTKQQFWNRHKDFKVKNLNVGDFFSKRSTKKFNKLNTKYEKRLSKMSKRAAKKAARLDKLGNTFLGKIFRKIREIFRKIAETLAKILAAVMAFLLICFFVIVLLQITIVVTSKLEDIFIVQSRYATTDASKWADYSVKLFSLMQDKHDDYVDEINATLESYQTADVQYPSGSQENYKEIFAAVEVMTQYSPAEALTYDDLEDIVVSIYDRTHKITVETYSYTSNGEIVEHNSGIDQAAHIYVNVLRNETILYEIFEDCDVIGNVGEGGRLCSVPVEAAPDDWLSIVKAVKQAVASTGCRYFDIETNPEYVTLSINGQTFTHRPDCSGLVASCLALYSGCNSSAIVNGQPSPNYATSMLLGATIDGFEKYRFSGWNTLGIGDILVRPHHTEIYAGTDSSGRRLVWNCGSTTSVQTPGPTNSSNDFYTWVFRPKSAGSGDSVSTDTDTSTTVSNVAVGTSMWDGTLNMAFSNMSDVTFNEETGNEDGYEEALRVTMDSNIEKQPYQSGNSDNSTVFTSSDWVRAVLAQHGVYFAFDDATMIFADEQTGFTTSIVTGPDGVTRRAISNDDNFKAGDIMFYLPSSAEANALKNVLNNESARSIDRSMLERTVDVNGTEMTYGDILSDCVVPLIYDGQGYWVSWCKDINKDAKTYASSEAHIRKYTSSELTAKRIVNIVRKTGYTIEPIYGSTTYFEGWTDYHVAEFVEIINNDCWTTGTYTIEATDLDGNSFNATGMFASDKENAPTEIDYSWYNEEYFAGGATNSSAAHITESINDLTSLFIRNYDQWGVLPSVGTSYSLAVTNGRSTEESLKWYNIFGIEGSGEDVNNYSYLDNGHIMLNTTSYKKFTSYYMAYRWWIKDTDSSILVPGNYTSNIDAGNAFSLQLEDFKKAGLIKSGSALVGTDATRTSYEDLTETYYANNTATLTDADRTALKRYQLITAVENATNAWNSYWTNSPFKGTNYSSVKANSSCSQAAYNIMCTKAKNLESAINDLQTFEESTTAYAYITASETTALSNAISAVETAANAVNNAKVADYQQVKTETKNVEIPLYSADNEYLGMGTQPIEVPIYDWVWIEPNPKQTVNTGNMRVLLQTAIAHSDVNVDPLSNLLN